MKYFKWDVRKDPKGLKKVQVLPDRNLINVNLPSTNTVHIPKKRKKQERVRKLSVLRSSPPGPGRGRRGRGRGAAPGSPQSPAAPSDLRSPPRRAPTVPGLAAALASPAAASPNADTPGRRRARRRRALLRCRNRNRGCTDNVTFTTEDARNQHERYTCRALSQVNSFITIFILNVFF